MPALPSSVVEPLWEQFGVLLPERVGTHPLGCHGSRILDRVVFEMLVRMLVYGVAYAKIADQTCSATTLRARRDGWITAGVFDQLEQLCLHAYDQMIGLDLENITVDGCVVKAPCGGEAAGKSPVDRGKQGTERSLVTDGNGISIGCVIAPANRHDSPFLRPTLDELGCFTHGLGFGLPEQVTVHLDAGYDSTRTRDLLDELGCDHKISIKGFLLEAGGRWPVERTNSWHNRGFGELRYGTERVGRVIEAFIALANAIITIRHLIHRAWTTHRWDSRPTRKP